MKAGETSVVPEQVIQFLHCILIVRWEEAAVVLKEQQAVLGELGEGVR